MPFPYPQNIRRDTALPSPDWQLDARSTFLQNLTYTKTARSTAQQRFQLHSSKKLGNFAKKFLIQPDK